MDWSRPSPSSPRLVVCGPVQSNLPFGLDWTEPYPRLGPSGLVESLASHRLAGVGTNVITAIGLDVVLSDGVGAWFGCGFGLGFGLSCLPGGDCSQSSGFSGPAIWVPSERIEASRPAPSVSAFLSSLFLWSPPVAVTTLVAMSVMPLPPQYIILVVRIPLLLCFLQPHSYPLPLRFLKCCLCSQHVCHRCNGSG